MSTNPEERDRIRSKLFAAAWRGEFEDVKAIIDPGSIDINAIDDNGVTALRFTAQFGHYEITKYLLNQGANPNIKAHDDLDPLMAAVENGDKETVLLLIENGADIRTKTSLTTPVYIANQKGHEEIRNILIEKGAPEDPGWMWQLKRSALKRCKNLLCR